jgi:disulfide bond formation protein DsbB
MPEGGALIVDTGYAVLALIADVLVLTTFIAFLVSRTSPERRERWTRLRDAVTPFAVHMAWIVAVLATLGSIYESQIANLPICEFCWFQRIAMYPLSVLLGIAAFRGEFLVAKHYFLPASIVGACLAIYHYQLEHIPNEPQVCGLTAPCSHSAFNIFGFISIPFLSLAAFLLITTLLLMVRRTDDEYEDDDDEPIDAAPAQPGLPAPA